jgi:hypothetical protein
MTDKTHSPVRRNNNAVKRKSIYNKTKKFLSCEGRVLFVTLSIFAGAWAFLEIITKSWPQVQMNTLLLSTVIALLQLPPVYKAIQRNDEPLLIKFSRGFGRGFMSVQYLIPNLSEGVTKIKLFWVNLKKPVVE